MSSFSLQETPGDGDFYFDAILSVAEKNKDALIQRIFSIIEEIKLSKLCQQSKAFDALNFRIRRRSLFIANFVLNENGDLDKEKLEALLSVFEKEGFHSPYDTDSIGFVVENRMVDVLRQLQKNPQLWQLIRKFDLPLCGEIAKSFIRHSLFLPHNYPIKKKEVRIAALAAGLGYIRQNVGSCFATAPAIMLHTQNIEEFYADLYSIFTIGILKRTFGGIEYAVPMSLSSGNAPLKKVVYSHKMLLCPAMLAALRSLKLITEDLSLEDQIIYLMHLCSSISDQERPLTFEESIVEICKQHKNSFSKEDLENAFAHFKATQEDPLLKVWEFTLASFSEVKMEFSNWNLYTSLGLNSEDTGGIGPVIYQFFKTNLDRANLKIEELHQEYIIAKEKLKATETLIAQAYSEEQIRRLKSEHTTRLYHLRTTVEMLQDAQKLSKQYADLYPFMIEAYKKHFPEYFQEVYDPDLSEIKTGFFDDAPAGFRLVFKHGRADVNLWSRIFDEQAYLNNLITFFKQTEYVIAKSYEKEDVEPIVHALTTEILLQVQKPEFIKSAYLRVKKSDRDQNAANFDKKPWAYVSGGTLSTLIKTYFRREGSITMENRVIENPTDLLTFLVDTFKALSSRNSSAIIKNKDKRLLAHSPTHAFLLMPGFSPFFNSWQNNHFTYTWVRDEWIIPSQNFWKKELLSPKQQEYVLTSFLTSLPEKIKTSFDIASFIQTHAVSLQEFKEVLLKGIKEETIRRILSDQLNSFLHSFLPLIDSEEAEEAIIKLIPNSMRASALQKINALKVSQGHFVSAEEIRKAAKALLLMSKGSVFFHENLDALIYSLAQKEGLAPPVTIPVGDSNWENFYFSFIVNPSSYELEFWRTDLIGEKGFPMTIWQAYLYGKTKEPWTVYTDPTQWGG